MKINIEGFARNMGLEPKDIKSLYTTFFNEMSENIDQLKIASQNKDSQTIEDIMHNIKGVCLNLELMELGKYAEQIYTEVKSADYSHLDIFLAYFDTEMEIVSKFVTNYYNQ
ncbi:MAG: Hpt domain-containing protein [Acidaminobacteraceae bacterium]